MKVFYDNLAAISIAKNHVHHDRTMHIVLDHHFIKEKAEERILNFIYTSTHLQIADFLTKLFKIGKIDIHSLAWGRMWNSKFIS